MTTWAGYTRVSRIGDRPDLISHKDQRERINSYAASRGLTVEMLPEESDISGGQVERPILDDALQGIDDGRYAGLIVAQLDRLSRMELFDALGIIRRIEGAGGRVIAVAENFDAATPEGKWARNMFLSNAEMQLDRYKAGFARSKRQAVAAGIWPCPVVPFGYRKGPERKLVPDNRTRKRVVRGFEARAAGKPWREVAAAFGVTLNRAQKLIPNPIYLGRIVYCGEVNATAHEALVSRQLWEAAQLSQPRAPRNSNGSRALLQSLVRCAGCGGTMTPSTSMKRGRPEHVYRCKAERAGGTCSAPANIAQGKLDTYVERLALDELESLSVSARERTASVESALAELEAAEVELDAYQRLTRVTEVGAENFSAGLSSRIDARDAARQRVAETQSAVGPLPDPLTVRELWPDLDVNERAHVLRGAIGAVWVRPGRGPASKRARVVAAGFDGPRRSKRRLELRTLDWSADLEGEIGPTRSQHVH